MKDHESFLEETHLFTANPAIADLLVSCIGRVTELSQNHKNVSQNHKIDSQNDNFFAKLQNALFCGLYKGHVDIFHIQVLRTEHAHSLTRLAPSAALIRA